MHPFFITHVNYSGHIANLYCHHFLRTIYIARRRLFSEMVSLLWQTDYPNGFR